MRAKAKTLALPGVDMREQKDANPPELPDGPSLLRAWSVSRPKTLHLQKLSEWVVGDIALCGVATKLEPLEGAAKICQDCRVIASKIRGVIR